MFHPLESRPQDYLIRLAVSVDQNTITDAEILAGNTSTTNSIVLPTFTANRFSWFAVQEDTGDIIDITLNGFSQILGYTRVAGTRDVAGIDYKFWKSVGFALIPSFSGGTYIVTQAPS